MAADRKVSRRQEKYKNMLRRDYGVWTENSTSRSLMICNAGLVSNCSREQVAQLCLKFGQVESIVMPQGKSYCFVVFGDAGSGVCFYTEQNGKAGSGLIDGPLYLLFLDTVPPDISLSDFDSRPSGLHLLTDFLTESEQAVLLGAVSFEDSRNLGEMKNRSVKHYGYEFLYGRNDIDKESPLDRKIPTECLIVFDRIRDRGYSELVPWIPDQLTVNRYHPGQGIPAHIDTHSAFEDPILSLSLGSDVVMDFRSERNCISVVLPRRSLLIMSGESRYAWTHGICPRKTDTVPHPDGGLTCKDRGVRTSFTFRKIKHSPCSCPYSQFCDSQIEKCDITEDVAPSLENLYVHRVYDTISQHFSDTRHKPWPNIVNFVNSLEPGSVMVDIGCGNGKYFGLTEGTVELGVDRCRNLIEICQERGFQGVVSDCLALPLRSGIADAVLCIAVIHHLATERRRIQLLKEMARITKVGGKMLIYAWAKDQSVGKDSSYLKQSRKNRKKSHDSTDIGDDETGSVSCRAVLETSDLKLPLHENRTSFKHGDTLVPWKLKSNDSEHYPTFLRFYHVFENNELTRLCKHVDSLEIDSSFYDQGNWCVILKKMK